MTIVEYGLYHTRVRTFSELIQEELFDYRLHHSDTAKIKKAVNQVVHVTCNLHRGPFNFLYDMYFIYYGLFIQPLQILLGGKQSIGTDGSY